MFRIAVFLVFFHSFTLFAQINYSVYQDSIINLSNLAVKGETDEERSIASKQLTSLLSRVLKLEGSFHYPFDSVQALAIVVSPDKSFRLFNWNEPQENGMYKYYCFVQKYNKRKKLTEVYHLSDDQRQNSNRLVVEKSTFHYPHWYGALYYEIIYTKNKKNKYYTLLGWEGKDKLTTCKVIDVLQFNEKGEPFFGSPILPGYDEGKAYNKNIALSRIVFEYANQVSMSLRYDAKTKQIIYDYLGPSGPENTGKFAYYGPDMSYDALIFKKGKWLLVEDIKPNNEKKE